MHYQRNGSPWTPEIVEFLRAMLAKGIKRKIIHQRVQLLVPEITYDQVSNRIGYEHSIRWKHKPEYDYRRRAAEHRNGVIAYVRSRQSDYAKYGPRPAENSIRPDDYVTMEERRARYDPHAHRESRHYVGKFEL